MTLTLGKSKWLHCFMLILYYLSIIEKRTEIADRNWCAAAAKSLQSCPTLCDPIEGSPPGSPVPGILQARILEWVAISFSNAVKWKVKGKSLSRVWIPATPWAAAYQAPPSMGSSRQEYWSGVPLPSPETDVHNDKWMTYWILKGLDMGFMSENNMNQEFELLIYFQECLSFMNNVAWSDILRSWIWN